MSSCIDRLVAEHERILSVLASFESRLRGESILPISRTLVAAYHDFFRRYVDGVHHHKEEEILFAAMQEHGFSPDSGPLAVMLAEHDEGRDHVAVFAEVADGKDELDGERIETLTSYGLQFITLLRNHIAKENNVLYPMALRILPPAALAELECAAARADEDASERIAELERLAEALCSHGELAERQETDVFVAGASA